MPEGLEESSKYGYLATSVLIYLIDQRVFQQWGSNHGFHNNGTITFTPDHGMIPFKNLLTHRKIMYLATGVLLAWFVYFFCN